MVDSVYFIWFLHRVPRSREEDFRTVVYDAVEVFRRHGAIGGTVMEVSDPAAKYGCSDIESGVDVAADEVIYAELTYFHDRAHYDEVMPKVDADPELAELYEKLVETVDVSRILRSEMSTVFELMNTDEYAKYRSTPHRQWHPAHRETV
ncbi:DUF1428 family protein [Streptomyces griseomycini]|uniref:Uncharacterized protein YbaA (DUF1428 family) n=1 Tax=Streptomyces griseomycini TaxID=66895 RepID=A0A7W7V9D2_9ACTN|nr:DUF1428 family protein [Streptomyces griseomycini]MBB4901888.1 uncharacterized protein YbaA (DUF1428 family) [Streptomyces griseomycini]